MVIRDYRLDAVLAGNLDFPQGTHAAVHCDDQLGDKANTSLSASAEKP
jgi:hypothetical protein